eukprot:scaffold109519_cov54-Phaeocystis_antarctica.AAC.1
MVITDRGVQASGCGWVVPNIADPATCNNELKFARGRSDRAMLPQLVIAALLASADALAPGAGASRRAVLAHATASGAGALLLAPALLTGSPPAPRAGSGPHLHPAQAQASDADVYRRAAEGTLTPERVIERAVEAAQQLPAKWLPAKLCYHLRYPSATAATQPSVLAAGPAATSHTRSDQYRPPPTLSRTARCPVVCRPPLAAPLQPKPHCRHSPLRQPVGPGRPPLAAPLRHPWHPLGRRRHARRAGAHHRDRQAGAQAGAGQAGGAQRARVRRGEEGRQISDLATNSATIHSTSGMVLTPQIG